MKTTEIKNYLKSLSPQELIAIDRELIKMMEIMLQSDNRYVVVLNNMAEDDILKSTFFQTARRSKGAASSAFGTILRNALNAVYYEKSPKLNPTGRKAMDIVHLKIFSSVKFPAIINLLEKIECPCFNYIPGWAEGCLVLDENKLTVLVNFFRPRISSIKESN